MYNMTITDFGFGGLFTMINDNTSGQFVGMIIIAIFFIIMFVLKRWDFQDVLQVDAMICLLISAIAAMANWISYLYALSFAVILAVGYFAGVFKK